MKHNKRVFVSQILRGGPVVFESAKSLDDHLDKIDGDDIVYEDDHTVAYVQHDDDAGSEVRWTHRFAIALKAHVPTLLDLDVADIHATAALLRAMQAVAFKYRLYETGFEIRCNILPPLQRKGFLEIKVRSGRHGDDPGADALSG